MRIVKFFIISVLVLFGVLTALSFLFPSRLRVSRAINVAASRGKIDTAIGDLRQWEHWNRFILATPLSNKSFSTPSSGAGAYLHSDELSVTVISAARDSLALDWRMSNGKRFEGGYNIVDNGGDSIAIQSWFDFHFRWYPWEKLGILVYDKNFGPVMEGSLSELKHYLEN